MNKNNVKLVIFDMDGTLADTSLGILNCHKYANVSMGRIEPTDEDLAGIIGGPLLKTYIERFKFSEDDAKKAVENYRARYAEKGVFEAELYEGMAETLKELKQKGYKLAVATLKAEVFAKQMLQNMGVADLFDVIHGVDMKDSITKSGLINLCLN
jgi:phosphoglycolate phosphatase